MPQRPVPSHHERRIGQARRLGTGTLACARCDVPVAPGPESLAPSDPLLCPYCGHAAPVRDFLSLQEPSRPAHVQVRVTARMARRRLRA